MFKAIGHAVRLARAGRTIARHDAILPLIDPPPPPAVKLALGAARLKGPFTRRNGRGEKNAERLSAALTALGPTYIKLGQFLATRPDIIGVELAKDLGALRDKLPPFSKEEAVSAIESELERPIGEIFESFGDPIAAASIAQVHPATAPAKEPGDAPRKVAVKVLRPGIEARFQRELQDFFFAARLAEKLHPPFRRLRPVDTVQTLADSVTLEMDLRLEAAAMSELAECTAGDEGFRVPDVDWERTGRRVLTLEWVDAIPAHDREALVAAGIDMPALATRVIQTFLIQALRDGFFHADMHQGNLFVEPGGTLVPVDFGIMGRLDRASRRFLAEILMGFILQDYRRVAEVHFEAGYVPPSKTVDAFAQALRAIGEPIMGRSADEISMARLLAQLFEVTDQFDMHTQPQLLLLQKTMVVVEGVARSFDPGHNIWLSAEPVLKDWMERQIGPERRLQEAADGAAALGRVVGRLPEILDEAERTARAVGANVDGRGIRLHPETAHLIAEEEARRTRSGRVALWVGALALVVIAAALAF